MLEVYSVGVEVAAGAAIPLNTVVLGGRGCSAERVVGTSTIQFVKAGVYPVHVDVSAIATVAGDIAVQLYKNGIAQPQAIQQETAADTTSRHALSFDTLVQAAKSCECQCSNPTNVAIVNASENPVTFDIHVTIP